LKVLEGRSVVLWPDNDEAGRTHMERVVTALSGVAREVRVIDWDGGLFKSDAADRPLILQQLITHLLGSTMNPLGYGGGSSPGGTLTHRRGGLTISNVQPNLSFIHSPILPL
jgi:hypothetical protein